VSSPAPAHLWVPPGVRGNYGAEVADVADLIGRPLDESQQVAVDAMTSFGAVGRWLALEALIKEPRQNGKTGGIITPIVFADLLLWPPDRIAWSAHLFKTCREAFEDHKALIDGTPELRRRVKKIAEANGEESIQFTDGNRIDYLARSKGGGRGLGGKRVVIDEALFFTPEQAGALLPILAAREDPQITYGSSGCKVESAQLRRLTRRGRSMSDPSLILVEFCAPGSFDDPGCQLGADCNHMLGTPGCVLDDEGYWRAANPAMASGRIGLEFMRAMRATLPPLEFAREFLGWDESGPEDGAQHPLPETGWRATEVGASPVTRPMPMFFVTVGVDGSACIAVAADALADGRPHVELADRRPGSDWLADRLAELAARWPDALFGAGKAGPVAGMVEEGLPVEVELLAVAEMAQACRHHERRTKERSYTHTKDPDVQMSFAGAVSKASGDGLWLWDWRSSSHLAPIAAQTGALWMLETHRDDAYDPLDSVL
jgi:hypothetical protein